VTFLNVIFFSFLFCFEAFSVSSLIIFASRKSDETKITLTRQIFDTNYAYVIFLPDFIEGVTELNSNSTRDILNIFNFTGAEFVEEKFYSACSNKSARTVSSTIKKGLEHFLLPSNHTVPKIEMIKLDEKNVFHTFNRLEKQKYIIPKSIKLPKKFSLYRFAHNTNDEPKLLTPLQFVLVSKDFEIPSDIINLNSFDTDFILLFIISYGTYFEAENFLSVRAPQGLALPYFVIDDFHLFFAALSKKYLGDNGNAFITYSSDICDVKEAIPSFGIKEVKNCSSIYITRMYLECNKRLPFKLKFKETVFNSPLRLKYVVRFIYNDVKCSNKELQNEFEKRMTTNLKLLTGWSDEFIMWRKNAKK